MRGKWTIPPDGGFDVALRSTEEKVKAHAETLAVAYVGVTGMPLTSDEWNATYQGSMRVLVNGLSGLKEGTTVGKPREYMGKHSIGVRRGNTIEVYMIFLEHIAVVGPNE